MCFRKVSGHSGEDTSKGGTPRRVILGVCHEIVVAEEAEGSGQVQAGLRVGTRREREGFAALF